MGAPNPEVDSYIENTAAFAQPILVHIRQLVRAIVPDADEAIKWGFPNFVYKGKNLLYMASFKKHCAVGFWSGSLLSDPHQLLALSGENNSMGNFGKVTTFKDLPNEEILLQYIAEAAMLIEENKIPKKPAASAKPAAIVPQDLQKLLDNNEAARRSFFGFTESARRDYVFWINEAKTEVTREKRLQQTIELLEEGKKRDWKYAKK